MSCYFTLYQDCDPVAGADSPSHGMANSLAMDVSRGMMLTKKENMQLKRKVKSGIALLTAAMLAVAVGGQAQTPGVNLLDNPQLNGQSPLFQTAPGPYAAGWTYTPGFNFFSGSWDLVSQSVPSTDLYYYDITFSLDTTVGEGGVDFATLWNGSPVTVQSRAPSDSLVNYSFIVTADGASSAFGLVGNSEFWSSLENLDVSWTGGIDPPPSVPDSPIGLGWEAALLLVLAALGGYYRAQELRFAPQKAS